MYLIKHSCCFAGLAQFNPRAFFQSPGWQAMSSTASEEKPIKRRSGKSGSSGWKATNIKNAAVFDASLTQLEKTHASTISAVSAMEMLQKMAELEEVDRKREVEELLAASAPGPDLDIVQHLQAALRRSELRAERWKTKFRMAAHFYECLDCAQCGQCLQEPIAEKKRRLVKAPHSLEP